MQQTQSIIVYRNPMEQQFWEGAGNNPGIILFVLAMMVVSVLVIWFFQGPVLQRINQRSKNSSQFRNSRTRTSKNGSGLMWLLSFGVIALVGYNLLFLLN